MTFARKGLGNLLRYAPIALLGALAQPVLASDADFRVTEIEARLLYEQTGTMSVDLTVDRSFVTRNVVIGEGSALENAHDMLVSVVIKGPEQEYLRTPLVVTVRDADGKTVAARTIREMLAETTTIRSMLLHDVGCAGPLQLEARFGNSVRVEEVELICGE